MPLTEEQRTLVTATCPICKAGDTPRYRSDTQEYVHDRALRKIMGIDTLIEGHSICWANGLIKHFGENSNG